MRNILVLNSGSSSLKCSLYEPKRLNDLQAIWQANLQWKNRFDEPLLVIKNKQGKETSIATNLHTLGQAYEEIVRSLVHGETAVLGKLSEIQAIGHRVVHGGTYYQNSVRIDAQVKERIRMLAAHAPLHNIAALHGIEMMEKLLPQVPQLAVFDTAFHHTIPEERVIYPVPYAWYKEGFRRYGFHGISYQYCTKRAHEMFSQDAPPSKMVICHLGAGASLCAVLDGQSADTTMGFTPLEGLMMNTRSGTIDPGLLLEKCKNVDIATLTDDLYRKSGLLGISGLSGDMRDILRAAHENEPRAVLAFNVYIHRLLTCIGSMITSLGGLDTLVFTAGMGENIPLLRQEVCRRLAFLGVDIDIEENSKNSPEDRAISSEKSKVKILIIHTQEALEIARECSKILYTQTT